MCIRDRFENNQDILESYQNRFKYILVDEYQDTNVSQYKLLKLLTGKYQNICCVGDDDQSIYSWRGAEIKNFLEFDKIYKNTKIIRLEENYRSTQNILNVASTAGISPRPNLSWYNATKGWMISATKAMAIELASKKIRVNALAPVAGETPLLKSFMGGDTPEKREKFLSTIPIGRFSTPNDMGNAACFLCSEEASMITGVVLQVDGGRCI